ncbi:MAG: hypothetical protein WA941_09165 [Nitrososphaeraceae archaeon]
MSQEPNEDKSDLSGRIDVHDVGIGGMTQIKTVLNVPNCDALSVHTSNAHQHIVSKYQQS